MEYYIEPGEQTEEVQRQLEEVTPAELNPEEITLMDPACGSGHILVEAYDLFKAIYLERGYRRRENSSTDLGEEPLWTGYRRPGCPAFQVRPIHEGQAGRSADLW